MKYLVSWSVPQQANRAAAQRFLETGGKPPDSVTQLGRWHGMNGKGCAVLETDDAKGVYALVAEWREYLDIEATPALEDDEAGEILGKLYG
ncbi:DUF3303 domain-containing protein [Mycobacterium sp.]|uniref:DUF3303 domain-containing protein n=1 Tax=Mycobacterium sp. TaxID=1785 RepID=UPI002DA62574|nr:DUF3303 family protein [Mycobacterium sp.]